jgi:hypothetical protein
MPASVAMTPPAGSTGSFTPSVRGSPAQSASFAIPIVEDGDPRGASGSSSPLAAGDTAAELGRLELAMFVARQDSIAHMESRLQQERQEILLELERSEQEMQLCRAELSAQQEEIERLRKEQAVRLYQDTAFFKQQKAEIDRLAANGQGQGQRQVGQDAMSTQLAPHAPQPQLQLSAPVVPTPPAAPQPTAVVSDEQLATLQARLLSLHAAELLEDDELYQLEDLCADFIALSRVVEGGVVTQGVVQGGGPAGPAALVFALVGLSEGMVNDGSFARQCRRRLQP